MKNIRAICLIILVFTFFSVFEAQSKEMQKTIDLSGIWEFDIDAHDVGINEKWFSKKLGDVIVLPGSMAENLKGDEVTLTTNWTASIYDSSFFFNTKLEKFRIQENLKLPFWLTPAKYYVGAAWYRKEVLIPNNWKGERVFLFLERPHTESRLWVNDKEAGMQNSLTVPHIFEITNYLRKGKNNVSLRIDNRTKEINVGKDSHSITDQTQGNWNGVVGKMQLRFTPQTYIEDVQVYPDLVNKKAVVKIKIEGDDSGEIRLEAKSFNGDVVHVVKSVSKNFSGQKQAGELLIDLPMGDDMQTWNEFHPNLYKLKVTLQTKATIDIKEVQFGMREFTIKDTYFYVNGQKTMLRGTVENCVFPLTGYAPMDVASWERVFRICRNFGLNHIRFHSFCPPEAAFIAADKVGFYLQPEGPSWPNHGSSLGSGRPIDNYLMEETKRMAKEYGNYASYCMLACGNEPRGKWVPWVSDFVDYWKATDSRRVYTGASVGNGWAWQPKNEFHVKAGARGLAWDRQPESCSDYLAQIDTVKQPYVSHETGQWCVFPDFTEIKKYTGVMKARNFELFREDLKDRNMGDLESEFLMASGKLQALCYKHEIEKTLRTPKYAGFQLLCLNDYSGQGTALVGVLNAFWQEKGYIGTDEFQKFCAPTVLLARMDKFVFKNSESLDADIEVAHFGEHPLNDIQTEWFVKDAYGKVYAKGKLTPKNVVIGNCQSLGNVSLPLAMFDKAQKLNLEISFAGTDVSNNWDFWVYPEDLPKPDISDIHITDTLDQNTKKILNKGGKILLLLNGKIEKGKDVVQYMTPAFWNTSWFKMRPPHTVGTLINDFHPVFADFPTDFYTGLQWWELVHKAQAMEVTDFPANFQAIVQPIDTWFINRKLAILFEAKVGNGKVIVCSADLKTDPNKRIVARQLYYSIVNYMNTNRFNPEHTFDIAMIEDIVRKKGEQIDNHTQDAPDELKNIVR